MQWTRELNDLLNQCVFASGYDFEAAGELFCQQATKLRLWRGDGELALTTNQCQEQWMALNPTEEEDDDEAGPETHETVDTLAEEEDGYVVVPEAGPRLELTVSDAELDELLSALPPSEVPQATGSSTADAKDVRSEMQWVLAFLTDPDAIASVDVEAKNLVASPERHDDDNYQVFLQDLHDANLIAPAPANAIDRHSHQQQEAAKVSDIDSDGSDANSDEEEWERTRQEMKNSMKLR
ncbi:hypothetical protein PHYPSEUDO_005893 [Phytophthora pseudosyringae]|uniref:Uncharacterized protein n=1 Tax=Phytophthora pseudosyringae TaxID=221518 RepID=A0A8T1WCN8_9STRA|nr:hypothetical protein PHYPSEUDO_005893 [Phytophthora pseudosyringae]